MTWIYLSPHLDDAALSCGGLIAQQTSANEAVEIWTICAGDPPPGPFSDFAEELHTRWRTGREATALRRREDQAACARLSAGFRYLPVPDCIYRRAGLDYWHLIDEAGEQANPHQGAFLYPDQEAIFAALHPGEQSLVQELARRLRELLPTQAELVCPLTLGNHVDHQLTRQATESLGRPLWYYADYPYVVQHQAELTKLKAGGWQMHHFAISESALEAWMQAVEAHQTQISTFWPDLPAMRADIRAYFDQFNGAVLWKKA